jgi:hypothetical protein
MPATQSFRCGCRQADRKERVPGKAMRAAVALAILVLISIAVLHESISRIGNEPAFRQKRLIDIGIQPVFDTPEQFSRYLQEQRVNSARLIRESGFQPR